MSTWHCCRPLWLAKPNMSTRDAFDMDADPTVAIRALNDAFRRSFTGGKVVMTSGVAALPMPSEPQS